MTLRHSNWSKLVVAAAVVFAVFLSIGVAQASNMGFKMNRVVQALGTPAPKGNNLISLPYKNPYSTASDVCTALGLSTVAPKGKIVQVNAQTGGQASYNCGDLGPFTLTQRVGVIATNSTLAGGIVVGSHQGSPPGNITLYGLGTPAPKGQNHFPVPYHTTAVNANDICLDLGVPVGGKIQRTNAATGTVASYNCGDIGPFALTLGESLVITFTGATINVPAGHPAHF